MIIAITSVIVVAVVPVVVTFVITVVTTMISTVSILTLGFTIGISPIVNTTVYSAEAVAGQVDQQESKDRRNGVTFHWSLT